MQSETKCFIAQCSFVEYYSNSFRSINRHTTEEEEEKR